MTSKRSGKQLRFDILIYLQKIERTPAFGSLELGVIANDLEVSREDIKDQVDILESQGAVKCNKTLTLTVPKLTGLGKALLETMNADKSGTSHKVEEIKIELDTTQSIDHEMQWDAFITHAFEDKDIFVRALAESLRKKGARVWYDEFTLKIGDSLRRSIDKGLTKSRYGIVVLSPAFFKKEWAQKELDGLIALEQNGRKVILPVWFKVSREEVTNHSPILADKLAAKTSDGFERVVDQLWDIINPALIIQNKSIEPFENQQLRNTVPTASYQSDKLNLDDTQKKLLRVFRSTEFDLQEASFSDLVFKHGLNPSFGYKDVQIAPDDPQIIKIERNEILPIIQDCRVKLVNFGGLDFPFESLSGARETRLKNAIQCLDMSPLPFFTTSFNFWQMNDGLYFASRSLMPENFYTNSLNETPLINTLNYSWVLMDIVRPLIFAHNILNKEKSLRSLMFQYVWSGLLHRSLIMSMPSRMGFIRDYRCKGENEWKYKLFIKRETNLLDEALKACINLFWLFGWEPDQSVTQTIRHDLQMFLNGVFPE